MTTIALPETEQAIRSMAELIRKIANEDSSVLRFTFAGEVLETARRIYETESPHFVLGDVAKGYVEAAKRVGKPTPEEVAIWDRRIARQIAANKQHEMEQRRAAGKCWEYFSQPLKADEAWENRKVFNKLGDDGWEMVGFGPPETGGEICAWFKRLQTS